MPAIKLYVLGIATQLFTHPARSMCFAILLVSLFIPLTYHILQSYTNNIWQADETQLITKAATIMSDSSHPRGPARTPVYFLGIGGPNFMENKNHPAYAKLEEVGREITAKVKPKAVVVFSAHWQDDPDKIKVNVAEQAEQIYDFYGFPPHYYEYKYPNKGSPEIAEKVVERLANAGIDVERVTRGLDHGVWAGFIVGRLFVTYPLD
jgi:hypothetical protein